MPTLCPSLHSDAASKFTLEAGVCLNPLGTLGVARGINLAVYDPEAVLLIKESFREATKQVLT